MNPRDSRIVATPNSTPATSSLQARSAQAQPFGEPSAGPSAGALHGKSKDFFFFGYQGTKIRNLGGIQRLLPHHATLAADFSPLSASDPRIRFAKPITVIDPRPASLSRATDPGRPLRPRRHCVHQFIPVQPEETTPVSSTAARSGFQEFIHSRRSRFSERDKLSLRYFYDKFHKHRFLDKTNYAGQFQLLVIYRRTR